MKKDSIPQDESSLSSKDMKEMCYAVDENGEYSTALSTGWKPKTIALEVTMNDLNERIENAKKSVLEGKKSPNSLFHGTFSYGLEYSCKLYGKKKMDSKTQRKTKSF